MKKNSKSCYSFFISIFLVGIAYAQSFQTKTVTDNIFIVSNPDVGESQIAIQSDKGVIAINSFWSEITAQSFKSEIQKALGHKDIHYVLNLVDRLDMFGGNAAYKEAAIIGHDSFLDKYKGKDKEVKAEIQRLIDMWRWKENVARERLPSHEKDSEEAINEQKWINTCKRRADELKAGFSLVLPALYYHDRMALNLGNMTLHLIWFGKAGNYNGMTLVKIPEQNLAIIPGFIIHSQHLAPYPHSNYAQLDVPRWITVLEKILEGEQAVETVICGSNEVWSREQAHQHLVYIRRLWHRVTQLEAEEKSLDDIQDQLSLDTEFTFVKKMKAYTDNGDDWVRPQHRDHVRLFFLQHKNLASEIIRKEGIASLAKIREQCKTGSDLYCDEFSINALGYNLMRHGKIADAIEVFKFNVELFPESYNVYDSLGEAYMNDGDKKNAIKNYKKSLELNPENTNATEMLQKLEKE